MCLAAAESALHAAKQEVVEAQERVLYCEQVRDSSWIAEIAEHKELLRASTEETVDFYKRVSLAPDGRARAVASELAEGARVYVAGATWCYSRRSSKA